MSKISKRLGLQTIDTHMGLFDFTVRCVIGEQEKALEYVAHAFEDKYEELPDGNRGFEARGVTYYKTGYVPIVWIPRKPETPREHATLAHEVIHAINHLFDWSATPLSKDTEETFAHSVAHVLDNIYTKATGVSSLDGSKANTKPKSKLAQVKPNKKGK